MKTLDFSTVLAISIHDMKNAINMLLTSLETLIDDSETCRCDPCRIAQLQYEARRVNDGLIQLLTLYRKEQGLYQPRFESALLIELLEDRWLLNKPMMDLRGVTCEMDCDEDIRWVIDRQLVEALLENVINNTIRYTRDRIRIEARVADDWLQLCVLDDGNGFPNAMLGRRSVVAQGTLDPRLGRTGLGLHFCALVADSHAWEERRGFIELSNQGALGGGCFTLALPRLPEPET